MMQHFVVSLVVGGVIVLQLQPAFAGTKEISEDFETAPAAGWITNGAGAGFDLGKGTAHQGQGNAWAGREKGSGTIGTWLDIPKYSLCTVQAWIRLSPGFADGALLVSAGDGTTAGPAIKELKLPQLVQVVANPTDYSLYHIVFNTGPNPKILFKLESSGTGGKSWADLDDFRISCVTP
jgi:hypothetical protein